jgi:flagella basal body P-ring formation protein FlgA
MRQRYRPSKLTAALAFSLACGSTTATASADAVETAAAIRAAIASAVQPRLTDMGDATIEIGAIDGRLRLPQCAAMEVSLDAVNGAASTAKVDCPSPEWTIYVPVRIHAWVDAVVAAGNLAPDTALAPDLLSRRRVDMFAADGTLVTDPARVEGKILRVGVVAGSPILASFLENPLVVHRGQKVLLTLTDGSMVIRDSVVALEDGRAGDTITMQNPESQKIIHATVTDDGTAEIRF